MAKRGKPSKEAKAKRRRLRREKRKPTEAVEATSAAPPPTAEAEAAASEQQDSLLEESMMDPELANENDNSVTTGVSQGEESTVSTLAVTQYMMVDSIDSLDQMMNKLKSAKEIAVASKRDIFRSFKGICCLLQISTRSEDFLVDSIALKDSMQVLSQLFTDSGILKVMYKAESIVSSLQKDFGFYVVNLFELFGANRDISDKTDKPPGNMYWLMKEHCSVELPAFKRWTNKWSKWHVRPLPADHVIYARQETHYMLQAKDKLQDALIQKDILEQFNTYCNRICSTISQSSRDGLDLTHSSYTSIFTNGYECMTEAQKEVIRVLHVWRYETAQVHDKGPTYVLSTKSILNTAKHMPVTSEGIRFSLGNSLSPILQENIAVVEKMILNVTRDGVISSKKETVEMTSGEETNNGIEDNDVSATNEVPNDCSITAPTDSTDPNLNSVQNATKRKSDMISESRLENDVDAPNDDDEPEKKKRSAVNESIRNVVS